MPPRKKRGGRKAPGRRRAAGAAVSRRTFLLAGGAALAAGALGAGGAAHYGMQRVNTFDEHDAAALARLRGGRTPALLARFPSLAAHIPWRPLGAFPTPVQALPSPAGSTDIRLLVKRDDLTSPVYGGNKVRKLEHFLADAELSGRRSVVTLGALGTHHGLATTLHATRLGMATHIAMYDQPVTPFVLRNLRGMAAAGATLHYGGGELGAVRAARGVYRDGLLRGSPPYVIVFGGSSRLGTLGHVGAALELAAQVEAGVLPEPDRIFVALGTCGTAAGLVAGCRLAGLRTRVSAVRVTPPFVANSLLVRYMANDVLRFLRACSDEVPRVRVGSGDFDVVGDQLGSGYGEQTEAAAAAMEWARPLALEPSYTGKALAACLDHCRGRARPGETVLYWHTVNSAPVHEAADLDGVPEAIRRAVGA